MNTSNLLMAISIAFFQETKNGKKDLVDEALQILEQNRLERASNIKTTISRDFVVSGWTGSVLVGNGGVPFFPKTTVFFTNGSFTDSHMDMSDKQAKKYGFPHSTVFNWSIQGNSLELIGHHWADTGIRSEIKFQGTLKRFNDTLKGTVKVSSKDSKGFNNNREVAVTLTRKTPFKDKEEKEELVAIQETAEAIREALKRNQNKDKDKDKDKNKDNISQEDAMDIWREVQRYTEEEQKALEEIARQKKDEELQRIKDDLNRFLDAQTKKPEGGNQTNEQTKNESNWFAEELKKDNSAIGETLEAINVLGDVQDLWGNLSNVNKLEDLWRHVKDGKTLSGWLTKELLSTNPYTTIYSALYKKPTEAAFNELENLGRTIQQNNDLLINELNSWERVRSQWNSQNSIPDTNEDPPMLKGYSKKEQEFANRFTDHVMDTHIKKGEKAAQKEMDIILKSIQSSKANVKALQKIKTKE